MRITLMTVGSRGDIQPLVALGHGLQAAGHTVRLATHAAFASFAREHGLEIHTVLDNPFTGMNAGVGGTGPAPERHAEAAEPFATRFERALTQWMRGGLEASRDVDVVVFAPLCFVGQYVAAKLGLPALLGTYSPITPTDAFPSVYAAHWPRFSPLLNRLSYWLDRTIFWRQTGKAINSARQKALDLPPLARAGIYPPELPVLSCYSPALLPRPADWPEHVYVTGFWFPEQSDSWAPSDELLEFLRAGPPPVYLGLGSMANSNPIKVTHALLRALARAGVRTIVSPGQVSLEGCELPKETLIDRQAPHSWLLPQTSAVICHGGIGTIGSALRAGVPCLAVPFFGEQFFWSRRLHEVGAGPAPLPASRVSVERAVEQINALTENPALRRRASELGAQIRAEDGVAQAVAAIEHQLAARAPASAVVGPPARV